jgi:phage tail sheath protein FI
MDYGVKDAQGVTFAAIGNKTYTLAGGVDYSASGGMKATLGDLMTSYNLFSNKDDVQADYIIMGPSMDARTDTQAKAGFLISLATQRKDCVTTIGAHKADLVGVTNTTTQTTNLIKYFSTLASSSYAIFDSGYKYTYDRFNNKFVYVPCNADVAGLMTRTNIVAYPWFSPAGQQRGILNNAIKLAYNPSKAQRDQLYPQRINSIITQPGIGTLLFGDKTALGYASAFDRINVRRLFLTIQQALQRSAEAQLFELNDELTRANFRNIVEPYLRDVQAKRGLFGFLVVCDKQIILPM